MSRVVVILKLVLRNVFRNRRHSLYALATITIGSMGLLVFMGFNRGTMDEYRENTIRARWGHGQLYLRGYRGTAHEQPRARWIENPEEVMAKLRSLPHVHDLFPRVTIPAMVSAGGKSVAAQGEGIDGMTEARFFTRLNYVEGGDFKGRRHGIVLGRGLAEGLGAHVDDEIQLVVRDETMAIRSAKLSVTGVFQTGVQDFDSRTFRMPLKIAQELLGTDRVESISVALSGVSAWPNFASAINMFLPDLEAVSFDELDRVYYRHAVNWLDAQFAFIQGIILLMVFFGIFNAISMTVMERTAEIGMLRANGDSQFEIATGEIMESVFLGLLGGSLGILGGWLLSIGPLQQGIAMPPAPGLTRGLRIFIALAPWEALQVLSLTTSTALAGSLPPIWRAMRIPIVAALRHI
jgi:putative ABC transport system permease protein